MSLSHRIKGGLVVAVLLVSLKASAQYNPWVIGLHTSSTSLYTHTILGLGEALVNNLIANKTDGVTYYHAMLYNYHDVAMEGPEGDIRVKRNTFYGLTAFDLFNDFEVGLKFGWHEITSPFGAYLYATYGMNQYKIEYPADTGYKRHELQNIRIGAEVELTPLVGNLPDGGVSPIVSVKTTYIRNFKYSGPEGFDLDMVNNGFRSTFAAGVTYGDDGCYSAMVYVDVAHYNIFKDLKTRDMNIGLRLGVKLFDD